METWRTAKADKITSITPEREADDDDEDVVDREKNNETLAEMTSDADKYMSVPNEYSIESNIKYADEQDDAAVEVPLDIAKHAQCAVYTWGGAVIDEAGYLWLWDSATMIAENTGIGNIKAIAQSAGWPERVHFLTKDGLVGYVVAAILVLQMSTLAQEPRCGWTFQKKLCIS